MTSAPGASAGAIAAATSATWALVGRMVTTQSASARRLGRVRRGVAADLAGELAAARPGTASQTATSKPAFTRFAAIGQPMLPMPTKPTRLMAALAMLLLPRQRALGDQHLCAALKASRPAGMPQ